MRRNVSLFTLLLIGLGVGWMIKNVKIGYLVVLAKQNACFFIGKQNKKETAVVVMN